MRRLLLLFTCLATWNILYAQSFSVSGGGREAYRYTPKASTGLTEVFIIFSTDRASIEFTGVDSSPITWYTFGSSGASVTTPINGYTQIAGTDKSTLSITTADCGYVAEQGGISYSIWVIDYSKSPLILNDARVSDSPYQCTETTLQLNGEGNPMAYYSVHGARTEIPHELTVSYMTLMWDKESLSYIQTPLTETINRFSSEIQVPAPLCNTDFKIEGDQILNFWGIPLSTTTNEYITTAVGAAAVAEQAYRDDVLNEDDRHPTEYLGGSAPSEIEFRAYTTDAVTHIEWQFSDKENFSSILARYNDETLRYTFRDEGITYVRLVASNSTAVCQDSSQVFTISIGEPRLEAPNMFTPETSPGVNDEWRVAYKSIVEFKCWIFDKWGIQMFYFDNPAEGWDGKYKGKYVDPGVYYYMIEAKGANNKKLKLKGHINILRGKN